MSPRYLARSPRSICKATKFIESLLLSERYSVDEQCSLEDPKKRSFLGLANTLDQNIDEPLNESRVFDEREFAIRHQERSNSVDGRPQRLCRLFHLAAIDEPALHALAHRIAQALKAVEAGGLGPVGVGDGGVRLGEHKGHNVMVGVIEPELNIRAQPPAQPFHRIARVAANRVHAGA